MTQYSYNYTAVTTTPVLIFAFQTEPARVYYLDDVSVFDVNASGTELLENPSFENSSSTYTGWSSWCFSSCATGGNRIANVTASNKCYLSTGKCFAACCPPSGGTLFLGQTFSATVGHIYTISYRLLADGGGGGGSGYPNAYNNFYAALN